MTSVRNEIFRLQCQRNALLFALEEAIGELSIQAGEGTSTRFISDHPIWRILEQARAAIAQVREEQATRASLQDHSKGGMQK